MTALYKPSKRLLTKPEFNRARSLAIWLMDNAEQINGIENVQIVFNCAGKKASVEMTTRRKINTENSVEPDQ